MIGIDGGAVHVQPDGQCFAAGAALATGTVTPVYFSGSVASGTPLSNSPVNVGTYTVVELYSGDANYVSSYSNSVTFTIAASTGAQLLTLSGPAFYLKLDSDGQHLDIWNTVGDTGNPSQSILLSSISSIAVNGTAAGTTLTTDFSAGDPLLNTALSFNGLNGASNSLNVVDTGSAAATNFTVDSSNIYVSSSGYTAAISYANLGQISVGPGTGTDLLTQLSQPGGAAGLAYVGTTASDSLTVDAGTFTFAASAAGTGVTSVILGNVAVAAGAKIVVAAPDKQSDRFVVILDSLYIAGNTNAWLGRLDMTANDLIVHNGNLALITNEIESGYNNALWTGRGLTSSAAGSNATHLTTLGVELNNDGDGQRLFGSGAALGLFDGQDAALSDVLVKYTYFGDTNLDGRVDGSDYSKIDNGYLNHLSGWSNGDFNYDGVINGSDYTLIDNAFNTQGASLDAEVDSASTSNVAEPGLLPIGKIPTTASILQTKKAKVAGKNSGTQTVSFTPNVFSNAATITLASSFDDSIELQMQKEDLLDRVQQNS